MSPRRAALALAALVAWVAGSALGAAPGGRAGAAPLLQLGKPQSAQHAPTVSSKGPIFILALGSDARPGQGVASQRADSIHIIGINPDRGEASILGFPRDSWVPIPGHGDNKINSALDSGGPELTVETVQSLTGIQIDYWALTSFEGLRGMIDDVGGVVVDVPYPMNDAFSRTNLKPGPARLSGREALSFSRDRHSPPNGDIGRSENQGLLFVGALAQFRKQYKKDPSVLLSWIGAGLRGTNVDIPLHELLRLAFTASEIDPKDVTNRVVPGTVGMAEAQSVVFLSSKSKRMYADMADDGLLK